MNLVTPSLGLIIWQLIIFILLFFLLTKFAWRPIIQFIDQREKKIKISLEMAEKIKEEAILMSNKKNKLLEDAYLERDIILKEAIKIKNNIIIEARENAHFERDKIIKETQKLIQKERKSAILNLKNQIAIISINIAEKILKKELNYKNQHYQFLQKLVNELK